MDNQTPDVMGVAPLMGGRKDVQPIKKPFNTPQRFSTRIGEERGPEG